LSLTGQDGLLKQLTKTVLATVLNQEMKPMPTAERQLETGMAWPASSSPRNRCRSSRCT
jgi:transposase-like protein